MSVEAHCCTCRYWSKCPGTDTGSCRRHTPTVFFVDYGNPEDTGTATEWPRTHGTEWCGEYEERVIVGAPNIWPSTRPHHYPSEVAS